MGKTLKEYATFEVMKNINTYNIHFQRLKRTVKSRFSWGIENIPPKFIEETLFTNGMIAFYKEGGILKAAACVENSVNAYGDGITFTVVPENGGSRTLNPDECVVMYNNTEKTSSLYIISYYSKRLQSIDNTIDSNLETLKTPYIVACSEEQKTSAQLAMNKRLNGEPVVYVNDNFESLNDIKVWTLEGQKNHVIELEQAKQYVVAECLTFFGINNTNIFKKERLTSGENEQNNEEIENNFNDYLNCRLDGIEKLKEMFGIDVDFKYTREVLKNGEEIDNDDTGTT